MKLESWEREPLWLKIITPWLKKKRLPRLEGKPKSETWYRIYLEGCTAADGEETYADFYQGTENRLLIFFNGGGVSWNAYTAARPASLYDKDYKNSFYTVRMDLFSDLNLSRGILENSDRNPFRNWSKLVLIYNTGDFHCGTGDFPYIAKDGSHRVCRHHGYTNFRKAMEHVKDLIPAPESLMVSGCSGGAFGAALLTDDVMEIYPDCDEVTCLVDSGFFPLKNAPDIAKNVWKAPKKIVDRLHTDNLTLDALQALSRDHPGKVNILVCCSVRDAALSRMSNMIMNNVFAFSEESGAWFQKWLSGTMDKIKSTIPNAGIYIFDIPDNQEAKPYHLTIHCIIGDRHLYQNRTEGKTCMEWIRDAVRGQITSCGLSLLGVK